MMLKRWAVVVSAFIGLAAPLRADDIPEAEANRVVEVMFTAAKKHDDPFNSVDLDVTFTAPDGKTYIVPAFWAGGDVWRVRYASPQIGSHAYRTHCSDPDDAGLNGREGPFKIRPYEGDNPLYKHGPIRVAADHRHFMHADGTPFFWLGDTWWMGLCERLQWPDEFKTLTADRREKGFNVVQIVAGLYPDMPAFDERGRNEAGFPWEKDYSHIRPEYFDKADERLFYLADQGITPCIVGAWGYHLPWMGVEKMKKHWRYLDRPLRGAAGGLVRGRRGQPALLPGQGLPVGRREAGGRLGRRDPLRAEDQLLRPARHRPPDRPAATERPRPCTPTKACSTSTCSRPGTAAVRSWRRPSELSAHPMRPSRRCRWSTAKSATRRCSAGSPAEVPRLMFWASVLSGAAGHTYGANGIWQLNRKDKPYGKSPHGGDYGHIPWDEAMKLPGSGQLGLAKRLLEKYPWPRFEPHPEWAAWAEGSGPVAWGDWIWYPEGDPSKDAPVAARYFRRTFELPEGKAVVRAALHLTVDDKFTAYFNGELLGSHADWMTGKEFNDIKRLLRPGKNVLAVRGENAPRPEERQPRRLVMRPGDRPGGGCENGRPLRRRLALFARGGGRLAKGGF